MLIDKAGKSAGLTKKAVAYYVEQGLVSPAVLPNGYRDFSKSDLDKLKKISVYRKLGLSTEEIRAVLSGKNGDTLKKLSVKKTLALKKDQAKAGLLEQLSAGKPFQEIQSQLDSINRNATVAEKLLEAFPGYYGRFICLHFSRFLNEPITTERQHSAYEKILAFLDEMPSLEFPEEIKSFLAETTGHIGTEAIQDLMEHTMRSIEDPARFLAENKEILDQYLAYQKTGEYLASPAYRLRELLKEFNQSSGYYDVFLPAMRELSVSYAEYVQKLDLANDKLLEAYPEAADLGR